MARPSKQQLAARKKAARDKRREVRLWGRGLFDPLQVIVESEDAGRVVCLTCGTEQAYRTSGGGEAEVAPCVGPFDLGTCQGEECETVEAYAEATGSSAALALIRHGHDVSPLLVSDQEPALAVADEAHTDQQVSLPGSELLRPGRPPRPILLDGGLRSARSENQHQQQPSAGHSTAREVES